MRRTNTAIATLVVVCGLPAGHALAQSNNRSAAETIVLSGGTSARAKANDWMIMPSGTATVGGSLQFVTARSSAMAGALLFTDVVLLNLDARWSLEKRFEIFGSASFLPKQPSTSDELVWQGAATGARMGLGKRYTIYTDVGGGPLLDRRGMWGIGNIGAQARKSLHPTLVVEGAAGGTYTSLMEKDRDHPSWLGEAVVSGELVFRVPNGMMAGWLGTEFRFPVAHGSAVSDTGEPAYDPQTRVNVNLGVVLSYIDDWDIFAKYIIVDRGDRANPATSLPILQGGFDQKHFIVGITRRYKPKKQYRRPMMVAQ